MDKGYNTNCSRCGELLIEGSPVCTIGNDTYCGDCAYILKHITEKDALKYFYYWCDMKSYLEIINNRVVLISGTRPKEKDRRKTPVYKHWRDSVFKRDKYTCQQCGNIGGNLNAHHIKTYKNYPKMRLDIDNGTTMCMECHRIEHRNEN